MQSSNSADPLPVHFFTIVLNGEPFIRHHINVFSQLPFAWHWHIVEGVADLVADTSWSVGKGGRVIASMHDRGRSVDGTAAYLDELAQSCSEHVSLYRQAPGRFWRGKLEMVNAPLASLPAHCLLWQVDVDEFWTPQQLISCRQLFLASPRKRAAYYWCQFFVGPNLVIDSRGGYGNDQSVEWLRTWRFRAGERWHSHEPPVLLGRWGIWSQLGRLLRRKRLRSPFTPRSPVVFSHDETEVAGLVFRHLAFVVEQQLRFKEVYYGYAGALARWQELQRATRFPLRLRDFFPWVADDTTVIRLSESASESTCQGNAPGH